MNTAATRSTHPMIIIASLAVTLFALAGIAALMGWLPNSTGSQAQNASAPATPLADARTAAPVAGSAAPVTGSVPQPASEPKHVQQHAKTAKPAPKVAAQGPAAPAESAPRSEPPAQVAAVEPAAIPPPPPPFAAQPPKPVCGDCGMIESVRAVQKEAPASGIGAAAGGVLGGVVGHQMGAGRGRDVMTILGAVGGAVAGHQVEKSRNQSTVYETTARFDDGTTQRLTQAEPPSWRQGDRVRVINSTIRPL